MKQNLKFMIGVLAAICTVAAVAYWSFRAHMYVNWRFANQDKVQQAIEQMVKTECLNYSTEEAKTKEEK